jgi:tRNA G18 (ribose-2'-O)-methylase SpoU
LREAISKNFPENQYITGMRKLLHEEIAQHRFSLEQLSKVQRLPVFCMLDDIRSLYNVGSMFRTADGARISKLFLCGYTPHPPRKEIEKTALGATQTVPWEYHKDPIPLISELKSQGIRICVLEHTDNSVPYYQLQKTDFPICLVVGNEITGVSNDVIQAADIAIDIPMYGMKQSLNAAIAFGIAIFDIVRIFSPLSSE